VRWEVEEMILETEKLQCKECYHKFLRNERLEADHPFERAAKCYGCPDCKSIDCFIILCDEPGCYQEADCGTPCEDHKYRWTCYKHKPNKLNM
jgi:hypothetical protein